MQEVICYIVNFILQMMKLDYYCLNLFVQIYIVVAFGVLLM